MEQRLSRFGVGPRIILSALAYAAVAGTATWLWPGVCLLGWLPYPVVRIVSAILFLLGIPFWLTAVVTVMRAYHHDRLLTTGVFALCRHPVYSAWIVMLLPALALFTRSWPLLFTPFVAYAAFKSLIHVEDDYLVERFGRAYLDYRARVSEIIPLPKRRAASDALGRTA